MVEQTLELVRGLVRPAVLLAMVGTALWLWVDGQPEAAGSVATFAGAPIGFWFGDRMKKGPTNNG